MENERVGKIIVKTKPFTIASHKLISSQYLSATQLRVYLVLCTYGGYEQIFPSTKTLMSKAFVAKSTLFLSLNYLEEIGLIEIENRIRDDGGKTANIYIINDYDEWEADPNKNKPTKQA